jgi:hypothetical protein
MKQSPAIEFYETSELPIRFPVFSVEQVLKAVAYTIAERPQIDCKLTHTFTKGLYCREIFMPAGTEIISQIHNTQHQWVALLGKTLVFTKEGGWDVVLAPDHGITEPGTQRVLRTVTNCVWLSFHPTSRFPDDSTEEEILKAVAQVETDILAFDYNPFIDPSKMREIA